MHRMLLLLVMWCVGLGFVVLALAPFCYALWVAVRLGQAKRKL